MTPVEPVTLKSQMAAGHAEDEFDLLQLWQKIARRKWIVAALTAASIGMSTVAVLFRTPLYKAAVQIQIDRLTVGSPLSGERQVAYNDEDYLKTQYTVLRANELMNRVIYALNLKSIDEFGEDAIAVLRNRISVEPIRDTRLVNATVSTQDPELSAAIANKLAEVYIQQGAEARLKQMSESLDWLQEQTENAKEKVEKSEQVLQTYREQHGLTSLDEREGMLSTRLKQMTAEVDSYQNRVAKLKSELTELEEFIEKEGDASEFHAADQDPSIRDLKKQLLDRQLQLEALLEKYKERHPLVMQKRSEMQSFREAMAGELKRFTASKQTEYVSMLTQLQQAKAALEDQRQQTIEYDRFGIQLSVLEREVETNTNLYRALLERTKTTGVLISLQPNNISVINPAVPSSEPYNKDLGGSFFRALLLGLFLGVVSALVTDMMDLSIRSHDDVDRYLQLPLIGIVPKFPKDHATHIGPFQLPSEGSVEEEAFRVVRTGLLFSLPEPRSSVMLTSAVPAEGKTTVALNLALSLVQTGRRVILLDCDMRRPKLAELLGDEHNSQPGLSSYLSQQAAFEQLVHSLNVLDRFRLDVVPAGPIPPNPAELLGSGRFSELLSQLKATYDLILLDTPPLMAVADGLIMASVVDAMILVIRGGRTGRVAANRVKDRLLAVNPHLLGVVLNASRHHGGDYYQYYGSKKKHPKRKEEKAAAPKGSMKGLVLVDEEVRPPSSSDAPPL